MDVCRIVLQGLGHRHRERSAALPRQFSVPRGFGALNEKNSDAQPGKIGGCRRHGLGFCQIMALSVVAP
jgi:hypothetical protein